MNRELGTVTLKDSRGKLHLIGDVEPEKFEGVTLGQTIVVVYAEALTLTLERKVSAGTRPLMGKYRAFNGIVHASHW